MKQAVKNVPAKNKGAVKTDSQGAVLACRVSPSSSRNEITAITEDTVKVRVTSAPVDGKANRAVIALFSKTLKVPKSGITILKGETGKIKKILVRGITAAVAINRLKEVV